MERALVTLERMTRMTFCLKRTEPLFLVICCICVWSVYNCSWTFVLLRNFCIVVKLLYCFIGIIYEKESLNSLYTNFSQINFPNELEPSLKTSLGLAELEPSSAPSSSSSSWDESSPIKDKRARDEPMGLARAISTPRCN